MKLVSTVAVAALLGTVVAAHVHGNAGSTEAAYPPSCPPALPRPMGGKCPLKPPSADPSDPYLFEAVCVNRSIPAEEPTNRCLPWNTTTQPAGNFTCGCCGHALFDAAAIYDAQTGWPAFKTALPEGVCITGATEARCSKCGAHLGDFFPPQHYCIDGVCLQPPKNALYGDGCEAENHSHVHA